MKKIESIPFSEIECPKSVFFYYYWVGRAGQDNFE